MINFVTAKIQEHGHLVNGTIHVPNDPDNHDHVELLKWLAAGNAVEPEFTDAERVKEEDTANHDANLAFLAKTDHKDLPNYTLDVDETAADLAALMVLRGTARKKIREYRRARE